MKKSFDLNLHCYRLLQDEPFFAALSRKVEKIADPSIPTAGVWVNPNSCLLYTSPSPRDLSTSRMPSSA